MVGGNLRSRSNRRRKKRKNNRNLMIILALAFLFFTILLALIVLNKNVEPEVEEEALTEEQQVSEPEQETSDNETDSKEEDSDDKSEEESKVSVTEIEPDEIEDSNVDKAYVGDWEPAGTNQTGTHVTNYQSGSEDRVEIKKAISYVTEIAEDDIVEWRVENGGDQKVIATISDNNEEEYFRVYLLWIDNQGWQVNQLEHLKQNDKK